jgi:hypothetical protein
MTATTQGTKELNMYRRIAFAGAFVLVCFSLLLRTGVVLGQEDGKAEPRSIVVDGFAVHGYANGIEIGYQWYPTREEAEEEKAVMEKTETTNGKYYDKVEITPEQRRKLLPLHSRPQPEQPDLPGPKAKLTPVQKLPSTDPGAMKPTAKKYAVWVFKAVDGKWVAQPEMTFYTDDAKAAREMTARVDARKGWAATTNAPQEQAATTKDSLPAESSDTVEGETIAPGSKDIPSTGQVDIIEGNITRAAPIDPVQEGKDLIGNQGVPKQDRYWNPVVTPATVGPATPAKSDADLTAKKYAVWVFKADDGKWVAQPGMTFYTDDAKAAREMMAREDARKGWAATTNAPEDARPPKPEQTLATVAPAAPVKGDDDPILGTWAGTEASGTPIKLTFQRGGGVVSQSFARQLHSWTRPTGDFFTWSKNSDGTYSVLSGGGLREDDRFRIEKDRLVNTGDAYFYDLRRK